MSKLDCITKLYTQMVFFLISQGAFIGHQKPCSLCSPLGFSQMRNVQHHWLSSLLYPSTTTSCAPFGADVKEGNTFWKLISCLHVFNYQINKYIFLHMSQAQWIKNQVGICPIWLSPKQIVSVGFGGWIQACDCCEPLRTSPINNVWLDMILTTTV